MSSGSKTQHLATPESINLRRLVPHEGLMVLLSGVLRHDAEETACSVDIADQILFRTSDGSVPAWIGLEFMAQCIAVHAALASPQESPPVGFIVSARGVRFHCERFTLAQRLEAIARKVWTGSGGLASFACSLREGSSGALLAEGRIGCFVPPADPAAGEV